MDAFEHDRFFRAFYWVWPAFIILALVPDRLDPWWFKPILAAFFIPLFVAFLRHRFFLSVLGTLICLSGAGLSIWYDLSGTKRPPSDLYTGLTLLTGLAIIAVEMFFSYIRIKALEKAEKQTVLIEQ